MSGGIAGRRDYNPEDPKAVLRNGQRSKVDIEANTGIGSYKEGWRPKPNTFNVLRVKTDHIGLSYFILSVSVSVCV